MVRLIIAFTLIFPSFIFSQSSAPLLPFNDLVLSGSFNYVSSATIQLAPYSPDIVERNSTLELSGGYGYSFSAKTKVLRNDLFFGVTVEFIKIQDNDALLLLEGDSSFARIKISESITSYPVEFTAYFNVPSFQENLNIYLGGGLGIYTGNRIRKLQNFESETISKSFGLSLVVLSGIEYFFEKNFMSFMELRFREGEYDVKSKFPLNFVTVNGVSYSLGKEMNSKVFLDGLKLSLGIGYRF
jgi:hypothetical protein